MGGGHDYGFPDTSAYYQVHGGKILNVDAHLDVRSVVKNKINSGTPFYRFAKRFGGQNIIQWGIQKASNSTSLFQFAKEQKMKVLSYERPMPQLRFKIGLSICLDAFQGVRGVSAPAMLGLQKSQGIELIKSYANRAAWMGIYECAPRLDPLTEDSARFAALLIWQYLHKMGKQK